MNAEISGDGQKVVFIAETPFGGTSVTSPDGDLELYLHHIPTDTTHRLSYSFDASWDESFPHINYDGTAIVWETKSHYGSDISSCVSKDLPSADTLAYATVVRAAPPRATASWKRMSASVGTPSRSQPASNVASLITRLRSLRPLSCHGENGDASGMVCHQFMCREGRKVAHAIQVSAGPAPGKLWPHDDVASPQRSSGAVGNLRCRASDPIARG